MMAKLAYGPASLHILSSQGPPTDKLQFYSTTYSTKYNGSGGDQDQFKKPNLNLRHKGTGYTANFRPAIYYSPKQDEVDNSPMRQLLQDNYTSSTKRDFIKYRPPDPNDCLPSHVISGLSGFAQNLHPTLPTQREVHDTHVDTKLGGSLPIYPRHRPLLHSIKDHDPVSRENAYHGPKAMSTECQARFTPKGAPDQQVSLHSRVEDSGYTQAYNNEPVTFRPFENHGGELPGYVTWRPTGSSIMKNEFTGTTYMTGNEPLQSVTSRANLSTGFVKGNMADSLVQPSAKDKFGYTVESQVHPTLRQKIKRGDPAEHSNMIQPYQYTTMKSHDFKGRQQPSISQTGFLGRQNLGVKEGTGYTGNTIPFVELASERDPGRFSTNYQHRFWDPTLVGTARYGHVANGGGVQPPLGSSFTLNTTVHKLGPPVDTAKELRTVHPYTARSLTNRHPYYSDETHYHKARSAVVGTV